MKATTRISKEERRREIIEAATREFAIGGLHGTPVDAIARQVGVSQPYLFQLFGTKKALFIAAVQRTFERTVAAFRTAAADAGEDAGQADILMTMGAAYQQMLADRSLLLMQMQAYAACADEEIRDVVRDEMLRLVNFVQSASGAPEEAIREWLAYGMLMNVVAAMDLTDVDADWARMMCPVTGTALAAMAADAVGKSKRTHAEARTK
ncbi:MAG TPA: TetR/AcrR family transcriptional regulator [Thermoleophilia bacterium]